MAKKKGPYVEIIGKWKHECVSPSRRYDTNLETVEGSEFKIKGCYKLKDFTPLKQALTSYQGTFLTYSNGYNPTKEQILNGEGKQ